MVRLENQFAFSVPRQTLWPVLSRTDWINRSMGLPPVNYNVQPAAEGGSIVTAAAFVLGVNIKWREFPFEWLEPEFYRVHRIFDGGPFREARVGMNLHDAPGGGSTVVFYTEWTPRGAVGGWLARFLLAPKTRRDLRRLMAHAEKFFQGRKKIPLPDLPVQPVNQSALQTGLRKLTQSGQPEKLVGRLESFLRDSPDVELAHIRPLKVAREWEQDPWWVLGLFLRATRCGLLDLSWEVLCPNCRSSRQPAASSLSQLKRAAHCDVCDIRFDAEFDKSVELKFSVNPSVRPADRQTFCLAGPGGKPHVVSQIFLQAGENRPWKWPAPNRPLRLQSPQVAAALTVWPEELPAPPQSLTVTCQSNGFVLARESAGEGALPLLVNPNPFPIQLGWHQPDWSQDVLTAARVTNWQEFRDLFASEVISPDEQVTVGCQVVLFTDLRGSTALYREMGDARAYNLVRNHFGVLTEAVATHHGAVVKTIGDAVMATFSRVDDALAAVGRAFAQLPGANPGLTAPLILKSSLHVGPCLAVNANDKLDYFGTTVNLAARMVECCHGGDLTVSDEFFQRPETARFLQTRAAPESSEIRPRGFDAPHRVWRIKMT